MNPGHFCNVPKEISTEPDGFPSRLAIEAPPALSTNEIKLMVVLPSV
jgi:hypothetical protein